MVQPRYGYAHFFAGAYLRDTNPRTMPISATSRRSCFLTGELLPPCTRRILPGFGLSLGITLFALSVIVLIPLSAAVFKAAGLGWEGFWHAVSSPRALAAFRVSISTSFWAAVFDLFAGLLVAWVLVRYRFPGRRFLM